MPDEKKYAREIRAACTNVVGFWQLMQEADEHKVPPIKRMEYRAYVTFGALRMADLIGQHHQLIRELFIDNPEWAEELVVTANKIKFLAVALDGHEPDHFAFEASYFAFRFLGAVNGRP